jgi:hypothetical protein
MADRRHYLGGGPELLAASAIVLALMHPSARKKNSPNFAFRGFSEVLVRLCSITPYSSRLDWPQAALKITMADAPTITTTKTSTKITSRCVTRAVKKTPTAPAMGATT